MGKAVISQFYKIILEQTLQDGKIKIPPEFVKVHGDGMQGKIQLEDPTGLVWHLTLSNCDGEIWIQDGWKEFAEYYSLRHGHFLVFKYERNSRFRVIILDMSATEIDYPISAHAGDSESSGGQDQNMEEDDEDDASLEILDEVSEFDPSCRKKKDMSSHVESGPSQKIMNTRSSCRAAGNSNLAQDLGLSRPSKRGSRLKASGCKRDLENKSPVCTKLDPSRKHNGRLSIAERGQSENPITKPSSCSANQKAGDALQKAQAFRSENPFFMVPMKHHHIYTSYRVSIPYSFAKLYISRNSAEVVLRISEKTWRVKYNFTECRGKKISRLQRNWKVFAEDNNLSVGDVCVFEVLNGSKNILDVTIFRAMDKECNRWTPGNAANCRIKKTEADTSGDNEIIKAQNFCRGHDIQESDDSSVEILYEKSCSEIEKGEKSRSCLPNINKNVKEHSTENAKRGFEHDQRLYAEADLESYSDERDLVLSVDTNSGSSVPAVGHNQNSSSLHCKQAIISPKNAQQQPKIQDSRNLTSERPAFEVTMKKYNFSFGALCLPARFMDLIGKRDQNVILRAEGGSWPVRLIRNGYKGCLSAGWTAFSRENCLEPGDVCVFELIKKSDVELKVSIFRRPN